MDDRNRRLPVVVAQPAGEPRHRWLASAHGVIALLGLLAVGAFAGGWYALGFAAVLPLLYVLPCILMMGFCMRGMNPRGGSGQS